MQQLRALFRMTLAATLAAGLFTSTLRAAPEKPDKPKGPAEKIAAWRFLQKMEPAYGWTAEMTTTLVDPDGKAIKTTTTGTWTNARNPSEAYARMSVTAEVLGTKTVTEIYDSPGTTTLKVTSELGSGSSVIVLPSQVRNQWPWMNDRLAMMPERLREAFSEVPHDPYYIYEVVLPRDGFEQHEALTADGSDKREKELKALYAKLKDNYDKAMKEYQQKKKAWDALPKAQKKGRGPLPPRNKPTVPSVKKKKGSDAYKHFEVADAAAKSVGKAIAVEPEPPTLAVLVERYQVAENIELSKVDSAIKGCVGVRVKDNRPRTRSAAGGVVYHIDGKGNVKGIDTLAGDGKPMVTIRFSSFEPLMREIPKRVFLLDEKDKELPRHGVQDVEKWVEGR